MITRINQWLATSFFPIDEERLFIPRILNTIKSYFLIVLIISPIVFVPFFSQHIAEAYVIIPILFLFYVITRSLSLRGHINLAQPFWTITLWATIGLLAIISIGINSSIMLVIVPVSLLASGMLNARAEKILVILTIIFSFILSLLQQSGFFVMPLVKLITPIFNWFLFALVLILMIRNMRQVNSIQNQSTPRVHQDTHTHRLTESQMSESENLYFKFIEQSSEGFMLMSEAGKVLEWNQAMEDITGISQDQAANLPVWDILFQVAPSEQQSPRFAERLKNMFCQTAQARALPQGGHHAEIEIQTPDGQRKHVTQTIFMIETANGRRIGVIVADITKRRVAEQALCKNEAKFRAIVENSIDVVTFFDKNGNVTFQSPANLHLFGYSNEEIISGDKFDHIYPEDLDFVRNTWNEATQHPDIIYRCKYRILNKVGNVRWVESTGQNLYENPDVQEMIIQTHDITDQVLAEQSLRASEETFRGFVTSASEGFAFIDEHGEYIAWNPAEEIIIGLPASQVLGKKVWDVQFQAIEPERRTQERYEQQKQIILNALQTGQSYLFDRIHEVTLVRPDGKRRYIQQTLFPVKTDKGYRIGTVTRDITEQKRAEEEIKNSNNELSMLFNLCQSLAEADNLDVILNLVNRHAVESIQPTFAGIALLENGNYTMRAVYPIRLLEHDLRLGKHIPVAALPNAYRILDQNEPMILRANDPGISNEEKEALLLDIAQTLCIIPLRISDSSLTSGKLIGLLMLGEALNDGQEQFSPEKIRLAQTIGSTAASAIRRMLLREQTERRLQQLVALSEIDQAIISSSDMASSLGILLSQAVEQLKVDAADILLFNETSQTLEFVAGRGFQTTAFKNAKPLHLGEGYAGRAALEERTIHIPNLGAYDKTPRLVKALKKEPFMSYYAVPLIVKNQLKGVLELYHRTELESNEEWVNFLHALANQAGIAIDNSSLFNDLLHTNTELTQAYDATILGWSQALDLRDNETEGHTQRVAELTTKLGRQFGLSEEKLVHVRHGALLHDIGKMGVPDGILLKPGPLTDEEWVVMKKHPTYAYELLSPIHFLRTAIDIPYCHHEKWDGTGYPRGLKGDQIPFEARIFAIVDVWDALTSNRPYRAAWSEEKTLDHISSLAGTHFDPQVVKICLDSGLLQGHPKMSRGMEPFQWTEKFSVGVSEVDQQHQQLFKLVNRLIAATGTNSTHSETISDILGEMTRYAQTHFITEERLMKAYDYPGLAEHRAQHNDFRKKTTELIKNATIKGEKISEVMLKFLTNWLVHHILEDDMAYRSYVGQKGLE